MYIRLKIFEKKSNNKFEKPLYFYEGQGEKAIERMIYAIIKHFFGYSKNDKVKKNIEEIKELLEEN
jgi:hypothetical protein